MLYLLYQISYSVTLVLPELSIVGRRVEELGDLTKPFQTEQRKVYHHDQKKPSPAPNS